MIWLTINVAGCRVSLVGVKPTPIMLLLGAPVVSNDQSSKLTKSFDARTVWPQCTSIGNILGLSLFSFLFTLVLCFFFIMVTNFSACLDLCCFLRFFCVALFLYKISYAIKFWIKCVRFRCFLIYSWISLRTKNGWWGEESTRKGRSSQEDRPEAASVWHAEHSWASMTGLQSWWHWQRATAWKIATSKFCEEEDQWDLEKRRLEAWTLDLVFFSRFT